jgi:hypothetical protein
MSINPPAHPAAPAQPVLDQPQAVPAPQEQPAPSMDRRILLGLAGIAGVAALTKLAQAGELSPPAGPISPTGVSLSQIAQKQGNVEAAVDTIKHMVSVSELGIAEPRVPLAAVACPPGDTCQYRITQPGAYCMTENVHQVSGVTCISVECDGVDLDCQGFAFVGTGNSASPPSSCVLASGRADIELYDCAFRGWTGCPIDCDDCDDVCVSDVHFRVCTCPASLTPTGVVRPGAMIRCRDGADIEDVSMTSCTNGGIRVRNSASLTSIGWRSCSGPACVCADACCLEDLETALCDSQASPMITCGEACECIAVNGRVCTCSPGYFVSGSKWVCEDCCLTGISGQCVRCDNDCCIDELEIVECVSSSSVISCGDSCSVSGVSARKCTCPAGCFVTGARLACEDCCLTFINGRICTCPNGCYISDMQVSSCVGTGLECGDDACVEDVSFHNHQGDCVVVGSNGAVCDIECRSCTGVAITCGLGACVEECAISSHTGDCVRCASSSCVTEVECRSCVGVCISVGTSSLVEDCDVSGGGGGGSIRCQDGSCVRRSRSQSRDASVDIAVTDRCSVEDCTVVRGQGISCGAHCCVSSNQLSSCVGSPDSTAGMGGAIVVSGAHSSVEENMLTDCRVAISVQSGAHFCSVDDNHVSAEIGGITGGVVAGIVVAASASRVMCTCNHLRVPPGAEAFVAGSSSFGPLVPLQPLGGDLSSSPPSAHHLANFIVS